MSRPRRAGVAFVWLALACGCGGGQGGSTATAQEKPAPRRDSLVAMARLEPRGRVVKVGAPDGVVARVVVQEGERVKAGQPLAYLEGYQVRLAERNQAQLKLERSKDLSHHVAAREAELLAAEAEARFREIAAQRYKGMFEQGLVSEGEYRQNETTASRARADVARAREGLAEARQNQRLAPQEDEAELRRAEALLEQAVVRAPEDGQVLRLVARSGERSGPQGVLQMGETGEMFAIAEIHANDVGLVKSGQRATFSSPALKASLEGRVAAVGELIFRNDVFGENPTAPENQRVVQVRIRLEADPQASRLTNLEGQAKIFLGGTPAP